MIILLLVFESQSVLKSFLYTLSVKEEIAFHAFLSDSLFVPAMLGGNLSIWLVSAIVIMEFPHSVMMVTISMYLLNSLFFHVTLSSAGMGSYLLETLNVTITAKNLCRYTVYFPIKWKLVMWSCNPTTHS